MSEIDQLADVHSWTEKRMETDHILIAGDLNAGGQFVKQSDWKDCRLRRLDSSGDQVYRWLIPDHMDTTATNTLAAYDRIISCGSSMCQCVVPDSAGVLRFDEEFGLDEKTTMRVSDHYPVYCELKPSIHPTILKNIQFKTSLLVQDKRLPQADFSYLLENFKIPKLQIIGLYRNNGTLASVEIK